MRVGQWAMMSWAVGRWAVGRGLTVIGDGRWPFDGEQQSARNLQAVSDGH
jgi:hypothetical protein